MYGGIIRDCTVSADISTTSGDAGGIVGVMEGGTIGNCTAKAGTVVTASELSGNAGGGNTVPESSDNTPYTQPQITWNGHTYQVFNENLTW